MFSFIFCIFYPNKGDLNSITVINFTKKSFLLLLDTDSSLEQPTPVVYGFDLMPAVVAQSPDHDLSTSVAASMVSMKFYAF